MERAQETTRNTNPIIEVQGVTKRYANHLAIDEVSFSVSRGTIFGLLGPNGAGKTTLIRMINQITAPDNGTIFFDGRPIQKDDVERIGYLPEERGLYKKMKVGEQALYLAQLKGVSKQIALERLVYWFRKFEIVGWWDKKVEELSKGMQQKVQFITTIIHQPDFLILDEPFSGFDPINTNIIKTEILRLKEEGTTIILSTHNMESVEEICDDIVLINKSKKVLEGNLHDIKQQFKEHLFEVTIDTGEELLSNLKDNDLFTLKESRLSPLGLTLKFQMNEGVNGNTLLNTLIPLGTIVSFEEILPSMNSIFIKQVNATK
ncbi:MAG: ABC transporter ATP-binding protein [Bacteroidales bacterium]|nr:ABC transporter ATP-binding protein [Bacteroidales bacterium]HHT52236.1 ATP-binding cassette domain-containing protein [Bacteroidales bacterium]